MKLALVVLLVLVVAAPVAAAQDPWPCTCDPQPCIFTDEPEYPGGCRIPDVPVTWPPGP